MTEQVAFFVVLGACVCGALIAVGCLAAVLRWRDEP